MCWDGSVDGKSHSHEALHAPQHSWHPSAKAWDWPSFAKVRSQPSLYHRKPVLLAMHKEKWWSWDTYFVGRSSVYCMASALQIRGDSECWTRAAVLTSSLTPEPPAKGSSHFVSQAIHLRHLVCSALKEFLCPPRGRNSWPMASLNNSFLLLNKQRAGVESKRFGCHWLTQTAPLSVPPHSDRYSFRGAHVPSVFVRLTWLLSQWMQ